MKITFTDNITKNMIDVLKPFLQKANEVKFGVAFVKYSGFSLIEDDIKRCLEKGGKAEFLIGLDFRTTEPRVLRILNTMAKSGQNVKLFCFSDPSTDDTPVFHPKIYLIKERDDSVISIGSSNLTSGGLKDNFEINAIIEAKVKEEIVSDLYGIYNRFKFQKSRFEPDIEYIECYAEAYEVIRKKNVDAFKERSTKKKIESLKEREKVLPKPKPVGAELFGWQKLVYEKIPEGLFQSREMYKYEDEFQEHYPENKYIRAKIRQILQQLRDIGLIKHFGENKWQKASKD